MALLADLVGPLLAAWALVAGWRRRARRGWWLAAGAGIALVYGVTALDRAYGWWAAVGADFSTHMAFAASVATSLAALRRRWLPAAAAVLVGYAALMRVLGYHDLFDSFTAAALSIALTTGGHALSAARESRTRR